MRSQKIISRFVRFACLLALATSSCVPSLYAQEVCRPLGGGLTTCKQPDGDWAVINRPDEDLVQEPLVPPAPISPPYSASVNQQQIPTISDCVSFGHLINITSSSEIEEALNSYFKVDLAKESDNVLDFLYEQAASCNQQHPANEDNYVWAALLSAATVGAEDIQVVKNENDAAVQAALAAQQRVVDEKKDEAQIADIPSCDDPDTVTNLEQTVANSPAGKTEGLELLALKDFQDVSGPGNMGYRVCNADALFNDGERTIQFKIHWFDKTDGQLSYILIDPNGRPGLDE